MKSWEIDVLRNTINSAIDIMRANGFQYKDYEKLYDCSSLLFNKWNIAWDKEHPEEKKGK